MRGQMATETSYDRGLLELKAGNFAAARRLFDEHEAGTGTSKKTREQLDQAESRLSAGDVAGAAALFEAVLKRNPGLPETYLGLTRVALFGGKVDAARIHAEAATKLAPTLPLAWTMLGLVLEAAKDPEGALPLLLEGAKLGADSFLCQFNAGRLLTATKRASEALPYLTRATALAPTNPDGFSALGYALRQTRQYEKAIAAFEKSRDLAPKSVDAWATLADVLFEVKQFVVARQVLDRGLAACGDHPALLEKALACAMMTNQLDAAIGYVERELKVAPDHEQGWLNLAGLYLLNKDYARSEAAGKQLVTRNPKSWAGWQHLGNLYEAVPKPAEAEDAYRKAIALAPTEWKPLTNLGALLVQSTEPARHAEAKKLLERASQLAPEGERRPQYNLALALVRLGDKKGALKLAHALAPHLPEAKQLEENLRG
ncbi:MAG: repeat protein [Myxococcaceae bacterium]|nr:repeat protein [Myxococcaceae bacterium]